MPAGTAPQGSPEHPLGLLHVHGNVQEWCQDWYLEAYPDDGATDPSGPVAAPPAARRVLRGGSWNHPSRFLRAGTRDRLHPWNRYRNVGFRVAFRPPRSTAG